MRAHEDGIAEPLGGRERLGGVVGRAPRRRAQAELAEQPGEPDPVLGGVDRGERIAEQRDARLGKPGGEPQRRLPAERDDDAERLLELAHVERALERQRLEVEPVGRVVVGRHRLGIRVESTAS